MRCLVVDDDPMSRALLERLIAQHGELELAGVCATALEAANLLRREPADLVFLDVEMPEMSGLDLARTLDRRTQVILVTGSREHAVEAFESEVTDFLLKPVSAARFLQAVERALRRQRLSASTAPAAERVAPAHSLFVKTEGRLTRVDLDALHWVEARGDYVILHTTGKNYLIHATMKAIEESLPTDAFVRVHRSHIVRLERIVDIEENTLVIERSVIPIGASYRAGLMARIRSV